MNRAGKVSTGRVQPASRKSLVARAAIELKPLPYAMEAFEPLLSKESFEFHWGAIRASRCCSQLLTDAMRSIAGKHHRAYVDNLNKQIAGTEWEKKTLEEIVVGSWANGTPTPAFNNAAQASYTIRKLDPWMWVDDATATSHLHARRRSGTTHSSGSQ